MGLGKLLNFSGRKKVDSSWYYGTLIRFLVLRCDKYEFVLAKSPQNSWNTTSYFEKVHVVFVRKYLWKTKKEAFAQRNTQECF